MKVWVSYSRKWVWTRPSFGMVLSTFCFLVMLWKLHTSDYHELYLMWTLITALWVAIEQKIRYEKVADRL